MSNSIASLAALSITLTVTTGCKTKTPSPTQAFDPLRAHVIARAGIEALQPLPPDMITARDNWRPTVIQTTVDVINEGTEDYETVHEHVPFRTATLEQKALDAHLLPRARQTAVLKTIAMELAAQNSRTPLSEDRTNVPDDPLQSAILDPLRKKLIEQRDYWIKETYDKMMNRAPGVSTHEMGNP